MMSNKFCWLIEKLADIQKLGEKVILFSSIKRVQELLRVLIFEHFQITASIINGEVSASTRHDMINKFNKRDGFHVIILSTLAAGVGVNVTGANHVIHMSREWNPAKENQATDRVYRIGQTRDVHVYLPISVSSNFHTLDLKLDNLLEAKQRLATHVIVPSKEPSTISERELEFCVQEVLG